MSIRQDKYASPLTFYIFCRETIHLQASHVHNIKSHSRDTRERLYDWQVFVAEKENSSFNSH